jgi:hypothetical protein
MRSLISLCIALALFSAAASLSLHKSRTDAGARQLFTSEGCETCPPADKYLQSLLQRQPIEGVEIIAMAEHVDYWNRLGWTDPFSSPLFSDRQKDYAGFFKLDSVYTPQIIVNGTRELRAKDGVKAIEEAAEDPTGSIKISIESAVENTVSLTLRITKLPVVSRGDRGCDDRYHRRRSELERSARREQRAKLKHMAVVRLASVGQRS